LCSSCCTRTKSPPIWGTSNLQPGRYELTSPAARLGIDERDNQYDGYLITVASTRHGPFEGVTVAVTLGSAEVDTRADGAIQVVGEPSDTATRDNQFGSTALKIIA
jgi:hypothetical protein